MHENIALPQIADTERLARTIAASLRKGDTVWLNGPLGAGKTTFIAALLAARGGTVAASSPTFVLCHEYPARDGTVEHWDLYRCTTAPDELIQASPTTLRLVEWAEKFEHELPSPELALNFDYDPERTPERRVALRWADGRNPSGR